MDVGQDNQIAQLTGLPLQLPASNLQPVPARQQTVTQPPMPLIQVALPEKRSPYIDTGLSGSEDYATAASAATESNVAFRLPMVIINRYSGTDKNWQRLVEWDVDPDLVGELKEISFVSSNDSVTRYRIYIANLLQSIPYDRQTTTPIRLRFPVNNLPGGSTVRVDVLSTDGTSIDVDGLITGVLKTP